PTARSSCFLLLRSPPRPTRFPYTTLFRSPQITVKVMNLICSLKLLLSGLRRTKRLKQSITKTNRSVSPQTKNAGIPIVAEAISRSEEHTSELQSRFDLVCRLLLEKKNSKD